MSFSPSLDSTGLAEWNYNDSNFIDSNLNIEDLNCFEDGAVVDLQALVEAGLVNKTLDGVKVLGQGELSKKLTVKVNKVSASAKAAIENAGGTVEVI